MSRFFFVAMLLLCGLYSYGFADYFGAFSPISETPAHASSASPPATPNRSLQENQDGENETTENGENGATQEEQEPQKISYFSWIMQALNWYYVLVFLTLSFILVALFVMNMLASRQENVHPTHLIQGFETCLKEKRLKEAYELAKNDGSLLGQVLSAGMSKINQGYPRAVEAMQEVGEEENMKMEHRLSYMALIGTISPMIGLFGTVHGMINSFSVIARENGTPSPAKLAEGISTALFTTLVGLAIAIPAIAAYNILRNQVSRLILQTGVISEGLMSRFEPNATKAATLSPNPPTES